MKITLPDAFEQIPVGDYNFTVTDVTVDEKTGKIVLKFRTDETPDGKTYTHAETYFLMRNGKPNDVGLKVFAGTCRRITGDMSLKELDPDDLKDKRFHANVIWDTVTGEDGVERNFSHIRDIEAIQTETITVSDDDTLDDIFG